MTVADTTAISYLSSSATTAGSAAESAANRKMSKYQDLTHRYEFVPIAIESHGTYGTAAMTFLNELGRRMTVVSGDLREKSFLFQRLSVALQRFNAVCVLDTFGSALDAE